MHINEDFLDFPIHPDIRSDRPSTPPAEYKPTDKRIQFCPCCTPQRSLEMSTVEGGQTRLNCPKEKGGCGWVYYDNPLMVSTGLVVFPADYIGQKDVKGHFDFCARDFFDLTSRGGLRLKPTGIALIKRGVPPFEGDWAFPAGFTDWRETARRGAWREVNEESGLETVIRADSVICACNPDPSFLNQITVTQLAVPLDGELRAGDDAQDVGIFAENDLPKVCFSSHRRTLSRWFQGRYAAILKNFFLPPDAELEEV